MKPGGGLIFTFAVLLSVQQAAVGQLLPGHSMPHSRSPNRDTRAITQTSNWELSEQRTNVDGLVEWESPADTNPYAVDETQSTAWESSTNRHTCGVNDPGCSQYWNHRSAWFADFLYMTARDVDQAYATHVDGPITTAVPVAPTSVVDSSYQPGFRVGRIQALDQWSSIRATFWHYQSDMSDSLNLPGGTGWIRPEVTHPDTLAADFDKLSATADYEISLQMIDLAYRRIWREACNYSVSYVVGVRYGHLEQELSYCRKLCLSRC